MENSSISIIIPAYNEEFRIVKTLQRLIQYLEKKGFTYEIIVVDDGSKDNTVKVIEEGIDKAVNLKVISLGVNRGKGYAVKEGMLSASGDYVMFMDADGSTEIDEVEKLISAIKAGADVAIGSRLVKDGGVKVSSSLIRKILRKILNIVVRLLLFSGINDTQCGFKMFTKASAKKLFQAQQLTGYGFDMEILFLARRFGYKVVEVPVNWKAVGKGKLNIFRDSFKIFADILRIRRLYKGRL